LEKTLIFFYSKIRFINLPQKSLPWKPQCGSDPPEAVAGKVLAVRFLVSEPDLACTLAQLDILCHQDITTPLAVAVGLSTGSADWK
jgi:hypothetical protein